MKVILVMAVTLDGKIGRTATDPVNWTGSADKKHFVRITREAGVMIMGNNTFKTIGSPLPGRMNIVMTRAIQGKKNGKNLLFTDQSPETILQDLSEKGYDRATLIGGTQINTLFAEKKLIDEVHLTVAPRIFGQGLSLFKRALDLELNLISTEIIENNVILLKYSCQGQT